jgi:uncharacterized protein YkwD
VYQSFTYGLTWLNSGVQTAELPAFHLSSVFTNPFFPATLSGLQALSPPSPQTARIHGWSKYALGGQVYVTRPSGWVHTYPMSSNGGHYWADVPFGPVGQYQVEILAANGLELFSVPTFHGVQPSLPTGPKFPQDPRNLDQAGLARFVLGLVDQFRSGMGLAAMRMPEKLRLVAFRHTQEMAVDGYYYTHPHVGANGSTLGDRLRHGGVNCRAAGEDIAAAATIGQTLDSLLLSPAHRQVLEGRFGRLGAGVARWRNLWVLTLDFCR